MSEQIDEKKAAEYQANQERWIANSGAKDGTEVTVLEKPHDTAWAGREDYYEHMDNYVSKTGKIWTTDNIPIGGVLGIDVIFDDGVACSFPFFVLAVNGED